MQEEKAKGERRRAKEKLTPVLHLPAQLVLRLEAKAEAPQSAPRIVASDLSLIVPTRPRRARTFQIFHQLGELLRRQSTSRRSDPKQQH